jgi:hypothetical protein
LVQQFLLLKGSFLQYPEHLWLYVDSKYPAGITAPFCKLAGKNSRAAAEIQHEITGLNKPFCKAVMPIKKPAGAGIKKAVFGCGGCFMMTGTRCFLIPGDGSPEFFLVSMKGSQMDDGITIRSGLLGSY